MNLNKIIDLPIKKRLSIFFILSLLFFLIGYLTCINPLKLKLHLVLRQQIELNQKVEMQNNQLNNLLKDLMKSNKLDMGYEQTKQKLKKLVDVEIFISKLMHIASTNFITFSSIKPLPKFHKKLVTIHPLEIIINGSYQKLALFADKLRDLPYFAILEKIKITRFGNNSANLTMKALLEVYGSKP